MTRIQRLIRVSVPVFLLLAFIGGPMMTGKYAPPNSDGYAEYARVLHHTGVFARSTDADGRAKPDMGRPPLYPAFLAAMMTLDPSYEAFVACHLAKSEGRDCPDSPGIVPLVQALLAAFCLAMIYSLGRTLGAGHWSAVIATALPAPVLLEWAIKLRISESLALPFMACATFALARGLGGRPRDLLWLGGAGACIGLLALTRTVYLPFAGVVAVLVALHAWRTLSPPKRATALVRGLVVLLCVGAVTLPWQWRNHHLFGAWGIGDSGAEGVLAMRTVYDRMTPKEAAVALVYWLPGFGDDLARSIADKRLTDRFNFSSETSFRQQGWAYLNQMREAYPDTKARRSALWAAMASNPSGHLLAILPLTLRGLSDVLWSVPLALVGAVLMIRRKPLWALTAFSLPLVNLAFYALLSHFRGRYGMPTVFFLGPAGALGLDFLWRALAARFPLPTRTAP